MNPRNYIYILFLSVITCLLFSCGKSYQEELVKVESLIETDKVDSAAIIIDAIKYADLSSDEDKALYGLLKTRIGLIQTDEIPSDSLINVSLAYYRGIDNKARISDCLFYKAHYDYSSNEISKALNTMYSAERYANLTDDSKISLKHKIYEILVVWNNDLSQYSVAEHYGKLNLKISTASGNKNWLAYAYLYLAFTYQHEQKMQLSKDCIHKALSYIEYVADSDKANFYLTLGNYSDEDKVSEEFFKKALQTCPSPNVYCAICLAEYAKGNTQVADSFLRKVNEQDRIELKEYTYSQLTRIAISKDDYQQVCKYIIPRDSIRQLTHKRELDNNALKIYKDYNYKMKQLELWQKVMYIVYAISIAIVLVVFFYIIRRLRRNAKQTKFFQNQLLINIFEEKLDRMKHADKDNSKKAEKEKIEKSLTVYKDNLSKVIGDGKQLYQDIANGGNTQKWNKSDYENYIEYYKLIDLAFVVQLESDYDNLSPRNMFYLILDKEGKNEDEIRYIMVLSQGSYRTMRTRIKNKKYSK